MVRVTWSKDAQRSVDAGLSTSHEPVEVRPSDEAAHPVGHGRDDVGAVHDPGVEQDLGPSRDRLDDLRQDLERGDRPVELPTRGSATTMS